MWPYPVCNCNFCEKSLQLVAVAFSKYGWIHLDFSRYSKTRKRKTNSSFLPCFEQSHWTVNYWNGSSCTVYMPRYMQCTSYTMDRILLLSTIWNYNAFWYTCSCEHRKQKFCKFSITQRFPLVPVNGMRFLRKVNSNSVDADIAEDYYFTSDAITKLLFHQL